MKLEEQVLKELEEHRDRVKNIAEKRNDDYLNIIYPFVEAIKNTMKTEGVDVFSVLSKISETSSFKESKVGQIMIYAAIYEILEQNNEDQ